MSSRNFFRISSGQNHSAHCALYPTYTAHYVANYPAHLYRDGATELLYLVLGHYLP
jgi:hypothetical protein